MLKGLAIAATFAAQALLSVSASAQAGPAAKSSDLAFNAALRTMTAQAQQRMDAANSSAEVRGSGPYPALMEVDLAFPDATIYRPADLTALRSRKLGVLIWGNGGCANDGASAMGHLAEIASHGYLVIAPGKPLTGPYPSPGAVKPLPMTIKIADLRAALDWALEENERSGSPLYHLIDPNIVATAGHSCGGMLAILLGQDPRIKTVMVHNSGIFRVLPDNPPVSVHEQRLDGLHSPVLLLLGGQSDVAQTVGERAFEMISRVPVFMGTLQVGHGGTFSQSHGGVVARVATDWLEWRLRGDQQSATSFYGASCTLCVDPKWTVRKKLIP